MGLLVANALLLITFSASKMRRGRHQNLWGVGGLPMRLGRSFDIFEVGHRVHPGDPIWPIHHSFERPRLESRAG
jgi:hypothetical protein